MRRSAGPGEHVRPQVWCRRDSFRKEGSLVLIVFVFVFLKKAIVPPVRVDAPQWRGHVGGANKKQLNASFSEPLSLSGGQCLLKSFFRLISPGSSSHAAKSVKSGRKTSC